MKERDEKKARARLLEDCKRPAFARLARYSKPMDDGSGDVVTRASVKFLEAALARWGNVRVQNQLIKDNPEARTVCVIITDLEGGAEYSKEILVEKVAERKTAGAREKIKGTRKIRGRDLVDRADIVGSADPRLPGHGAQTGDGRPDGDAFGRGD